ncbi:MAG: hypothetical protein V7633_1583 [Pseudonocardia sp.]
MTRRPIPSPPGDPGRALTGCQTMNENSATPAGRELSTCREEFRTRWVRHNVRCHRSGPNGSTTRPWVTCT